jgi:MFS family permease
MFFFMTLYVQNILGFSPIRTGLGFLVTPIVIAIFSGVTAQLVGRIGYKPTMVVGPLILAVGLWVLSGIRVNGTYWHDVFPGLVICGMGLGFSFVSLTLAATSGVPKQLSGLISGVLNTVQQVGGAVGLAILSEIAGSATKSDLRAGLAPAQAQVHGYHAALQVGMYFALVSALAALLIIRNQKVSAAEAMPS